MKRLLLISLLLPHAGFAADKPACSERELRALDCRISVGSFRVRLLPESVARDNGTWHSVDEMPLKGPDIKWEKIRFDLMAERPILQMWLWDAGQGEAKVQSLHWFVAEAGNSAMTILQSGVVRRRRQKPEHAGEFIYDDWEKHDLRRNKSGDLEWSLGKKKKTIEKVQHGKGI